MHNMEQPNKGHDNVPANLPESPPQTKLESKGSLQVDSLIDIDVSSQTTEASIEPMLTPTKTTAIVDAAPAVAPSPAMTTENTAATTTNSFQSNIGPFNTTTTDKSQTEPAHDNTDEARDRTDSIASNSTILPETGEANELIDLDPREELKRLKAEKQELEQLINRMRIKMSNHEAELEREVQKRVDLEQRFTEEAKRTTDQIEELIAKSESDDAKLAEVKRKFDLYTRETSSMIEHFTTNRELLTSQLVELRNENDYLLSKYLSKASDLQSADIDLPQSVEELQFHCLTLNEKLILTTLAKERLEETLVQSTANANKSNVATATGRT